MWWSSSGFLWYYALLLHFWIEFELRGPISYVRVVKSGHVHNAAPSWGSEWTAYGLFCVRGSEDEGDRWEVKVRRFSVFLGAFAKLWKATVGFRHDCPLGVTQLPSDEFSWNFVFDDLLEMFREISRFY
jgi:hypothetical protein